MPEQPANKDSLKPAPRNPDIPVPPQTEAEVEADKIKRFIKEYGQSVVIGLGLALALVLGIGAYRNYKASQSVRANQLLMSARSSEELQQIVNQYSATPVAPVAMLTLAGQHYDAGQYDLARFTYAQFAQKYPEHPLRGAAEIGQAQALEGSGQLEQAVEAFSTFEKANAKSFLAPVATLGRARCMAQLGRFDEAKAIYEDFIAANPNNSWVSLAETALLFVDKDVRAREKGLDDTAAVSAPALDLAPATPFFQALPAEDSAPAPAAALSAPGEEEPAR